MTINTVYIVVKVSPKTTSPIIKSLDPVIPHAKAKITYKHCPSETPLIVG